MNYRIINADVIEGLRKLPDASVQTCITSPPYYGLRDYGVAGQIGLKETPDAYVARLVDVFREVRRVLADDGSVWLNLGDSYGSGKQLQMIPARVALALQADGWCLRSEIIWHKPNPMPESVKDRPTKAHEQVFLLTKSERYFYDAGAIAEPCVVGFNGSSFTSAYDIATKPGLGQVERAERETRNKRSVWTITAEPFPEAHFAVMPEALVEPCVLAGCPEGGTVLDTFVGSGTVGVVALKTGRNFVGTELNPEYAAMARRRLARVMPMFAEELIA